MEDGEDVFVRHGFDDANGKEQSQHHDLPGFTAGFEVPLGPAEEHVFEVGGGGEHEDGAAEPHFEIALQFGIVGLDAKDAAQQKAEEGNGDEAGDDPDDGAQDGLKNEVGEDSGDRRRHAGT